MNHQLPCVSFHAGNGLAPPSLAPGVKLRIGVIDSVDSRTIKNYCIRNYRGELLYFKKIFDVFVWSPGRQSNTIQRSGLARDGLPWHRRCNNNINDTSMKQNTEVDWSICRWDACFHHRRFWSALPTCHVWLVPTVPSRFSSHLLPQLRGCRQKLCVFV